ncbi:MAG: inositol 2-dehydrogenase [Campylobacteraceae bacterium]|nr:inositol 2-dehydrogenase [Campylobacteraceae bacterium]
MRTLKIGIVGLGRMGQEHLKIISEYISGAKVKAVCDIEFNQEAKDLIKKYHIREKYTDYKEMLEDKLLDIIYVCTPIDYLTTISIDCIKAGKHTFSEENLSKDVESIFALMDVLKTSKSKFFVGLNKRFDNNFNSVRDTVIKGKVGEPHIIKITSRDPDFPSMEYLKNSGGLFYDMTVDDFDMLRYLTGDEIEEVYAMGSVLIDDVIKEFDDIDTATINVRLKKGTLCVIDNSRRALYGYDQRIEVHGSLGMVTTSNELQSKAKIYTGYGVIEEKPQYMILERYRHAYIKETEHFLECIIEDKEPLTGCKEALEALYASKAAMKSYLENRPVKLSEVK